MKKSQTTEVGFRQIGSVLLNASMHKQHVRSSQRALSDEVGRAKDKVRESEQKIQDYVQHLNSYGQFAVVRYSNGVLVVPAGEGEQEVRFCREDLFSDMASVNDNYWDSLPKEVPNTAEKHILFTFETISAAVYAFQHSFPVISLDACTIKCPHTKGYLLPATFETTHGHLLTTTVWWRNLEFCLVSVISRCARRRRLRPVEVFIRPSH